MNRVKIAKMLALMPVVALAAACNGSGVSPVSSTDLSTGVSATDAGDVSSTSTTLRACDVTGVSLRTDDSTSPTMIWVEAAYLPFQPASTTCRAPRWTSDRDGLVVDRSNPYRAGYRRTERGVVNVTATAPNGAQNTLRVVLGGNTQFAAPGDNASCRLISGVDVRTVPVIGANTVSFEATYVYVTRPESACTVAPRWSASRRGLTVAKDGFHASIERQATVRTTVTATAPNGVQDSLTF